MPLRNPTSVAELREIAQQASAEHSRKEKQPKTKADAIRALREEIAQLRHQGFTWEEVAEVFKSTLDASAATMRLAIGTKTRTRKKSVGQAQGKGAAAVSKKADETQPKANHGVLEQSRSGKLTGEASASNLHHAANDRSGRKA